MRDKGRKLAYLAAVFEDLLTGAEERRVAVKPATLVLGVESS